MKKALFVSALTVASAVFADADLLNRPAGIKVGDRLTLSPYVSFSFTYDSNPDSARTGDGGGQYFTANPGLGISFKADEWNINGSVYYNYHAYTSRFQKELDNSSYGEQLGISWSNLGTDGGWSANLSERWSKVDQNDDFKHSDGKGLWRNRGQFDVSAALHRRFNRFLHAGVNAGFYWLDYANDSNSYAPLYGWDRWNAGAQIGFTLSQWTDLFLSGTYSSYTQDNDGGQVSSESHGYTVHAGFGSYMTDKIQYSISAGMSTFEYGDTSSSKGFTYQGDIRWRISDTWSTTLLFSSYYQPSEREYNSSSRNDSLSWGLSKSLVNGKLNATFDVAYRHETTEYCTTSTADNDYNMLTARLGFSYSLNRLLSFFLRGEYQEELNCGEAIDCHYNYERWRITFGMRFSY